MAAQRLSACHRMHASTIPPASKKRQDSRPAMCPAHFAPRRSEAAPNVVTPNLFDIVSVSFMVSDKSAGHVRCAHALPYGRFQKAEAPGQERPALLSCAN